MSLQWTQIQQRRIAREYTQAPDELEINKIRQSLNSEIEARIKEIVQQTEVTKTNEHSSQTESVTSKARIRQRLQDEQTKMNTLITRGCHASERAEEAKKVIQEATAEADRCLKEAELSMAKIQELTRQLQVLDRESYIRVREFKKKRRTESE